MREGATLDEQTAVLAALRKYQDDGTSSLVPRAHALAGAVARRAGALDDIRLVFSANYTRFDNFSAKTQ